MIKYLKQLIESTTKSSSKRFIALLLTVCVIAAHVPVWINGETMEIIYLVGTDMTFIATLLGIASYQSNVKTRVDGPKSKTNGI